MLMGHRKAKMRVPGSTGGNRSTSTASLWRLTDQIHEHWLAAETEGQDYHIILTKAHKGLHTSSGRDAKTSRRPVIPPTTQMPALCYTCPSIHGP